MPRVSKFPLRPNIKNDILQEFWHTLGDLNTKEIFILFKEFLTPTEILMLAKRLAILRALHEGVKYEDIRLMYKVTNATISNVNSLRMKLPDEALKIIDKLIKAEDRRWEAKRQSRMVKSSKLVFPRRA